jgi:hypothetical protein
MQSKKKIFPENEKRPDEFRQKFRRGFIGQEAFPAPTSIRRLVA